MIWKKTLFILWFAISMVNYLWGQEPFQNPLLTPDERAHDLLGKLTLEEKIALMQNASPGIERLGIPPMDWWNEALHGVARAGKATVFPQTIGLAATFDAEGVRKTFSMISDEARAKHHEFKRRHSFKRYQGLTFWTPNINIFRDPRWGRGMETYGEDPYLTTCMGIAAVEGLQGDTTQQYDKTHACAKHYAVHSGPEWNRHSFDAKNISERDLWETYLPAFKALVEKAHVKEVMCAYNRFEGKPCCSSDELLIHILREEWGFKDVIVSDCGAIDDFYKKGNHETHAGPAEASADAVITGTDLVCGKTYQALGEAVKKGLITEKQLDISLLRLLRARFQLGMFDPDSLVSWASIPYSVVECDQHVQQALEMARKSIVLLKNNQILPLNKNRKVAVVGPNAADSVMLWANYNGTPTRSTTILQGIQSKLLPGNLIYEKGCDYVEHRVFSDKLSCCSYEGTPGFKATFWNTPDLSGEIAATTTVTGSFSFDIGGNTVFAPGVNLTNFSARFETVYLPDEDGETVMNIYADDGYRIYLDGKEVIADWNTSKKAAKEYIFSSVKGKPVNIVIEYFQKEGNAYLKFSLGQAREMDYQQVANKVKDADVIVFAGGISSRIEGEEMRVDLPGFRRGDRTRIELPEVQQKLLKTLQATGKPIVFVLCSGSSMALPWENENIDALLTAWYPGQEGGKAVADVLFGDYNPAGRLPLTFYASTDELPDFEDYHMNKGRTYRYYRGTPVYPFGYGLSYTTFDYLSARLNKKKEELSIDIQLKNTGKYAGDEVIQVYVRNLQDPEGPIKSLRAFQRVHLSPGEKRTFRVALPDTAFEFFDSENGRPAIKPGKYEILYGGSSDERGLQKLTYTIK